MEPPDASTPQENARRMFQLIYSNWQTCVTYAFAELAIADLLHGSPRTVEQLAGETGTDARALGRFLRCAATLDFIRSEGEGRYALTPFGGLLRSDHPFSHHAAAQLNGAPYRYQPWGRLIDVLKTGSGTGISPAFERGSLDYLEDKAELRQVFHRAMTDLSGAENGPVAGAYDFTGFAHVVDIGGGEGTFLRTLLKANPHLQGTLFDLEISPGGAEEDGLAGRLHRRAGDFFAEVPPDGDVYTMKNVVHNWPEDKVLRLLRNVRGAMVSAAGSPRPPAEKRLLIIEHLIPEGDELSVAKWLDLNFMILVGGAERTLAEYRDLAGRAGFDLARALPTPAGRRILELVPR
jgi:C-methyltransferase